LTSVSPRRSPKELWNRISAEIDMRHPLEAAKPRATKHAKHSN
jgi:hypothetical protein